MRIKFEDIVAKNPTLLGGLKKIIATINIYGQVKRT